MKIVLSKVEFQNFAMSALKTKYDNLLQPLSDEEVIVTQKYDGDVEIEIIPKESTDKEE